MYIINVKRQAPDAYIHLSNLYYIYVYFSKLDSYI